MAQIAVEKYLRTRRKGVTVFDIAIKAPLEYLIEIYGDAGRMNHLTTIARLARYFHPDQREIILSLSKVELGKLLDACTTVISSSELNPKRGSVRLFQVHKDELLSSLSHYKQFLTILLFLVMSLI